MKRAIGKTSLACLACVALLGCLVAWPLAVRADEPSQDAARWEQLTPEQQQALVERYQRFKSLPPERQAELMARFERFSALSPAEKQELLANWKAFRSLSPAEQRWMLKSYKKFIHLPAEQRERLSKLFDRIMKMTPELRHQFFQKVKHHARPGEPGSKGAGNGKALGHDKIKVKKDRK
jgi:hypothetical protein